MEFGAGSSSRPPRPVMGCRDLELKHHAVYEEALRRFPTSTAAPEAQYFLAVSKYKASHESSDLLGGWKEPQDRYPDSIWRVKQSFTEDG